MNVTQPHRLSSVPSPTYTTNKTNAITERASAPMERRRRGQVSSSDTVALQAPAPRASTPRRLCSPSASWSATSSLSANPKGPRSEVAPASPPLQHLPPLRPTQPPTIHEVGGTHVSGDDASCPRSRHRALSAAVEIQREATPLVSPSQVSSAPCSTPQPASRTNSHRPTTATVVEANSTPPQQDFAATPAPLTQCTPSVVPLQPTTRLATNTTAFEVMMNHTRLSVDRRYPFLNPASLFTAHAPSGVAGSVELAADLVPPLHQYGHRPVLLLDYTGTLHMRHQRRQRQREIKEEIIRLEAEHADQVRIGRMWRMRRLRARRGNHADFIASDADRVISATGARRLAISHQLQGLREELAYLAQVKRYAEATREGCVLLLPSPETQEVRLCSGHHYRTVCFVGQELMDIVPGEGPVPRPLPTTETPAAPAPKVTAAASVRSVSPASHSDHPPHRHRRRRRSESTDARSRAVTDGASHTDADAVAPMWANAELRGFSIYRRVQRFSRKLTRCRTCGDGESNDEGCAAMAAYLALPACEAAMYREWAIRKDVGDAT
jgi:hypothetical protein